MSASSRRCSLCRSWLAAAVALVPLSLLAAPPREMTAPDVPIRPRSHLQPVSEMVAVAPSRDFGLRLSRAPVVLREQLALPRGAGLVVEAVDPGSAAARAGFQVNDVVVRIDEQLLLLPEQFTALVDATPADTAVACHLVRAGRPLTVRIDEAVAMSLDRREPPVGGSLRPTPSTLSLLPRGVAASDRPAPPPSDALASASPAGTAAQIAPPETLLRQDADYQIRLTAGDETRLVVTDRDGRLVFNDCIDTPEARSRMPLVIRERVAHMERQLERHAAAADEPVAAVGALDVTPIQIR